MQKVGKINQGTENQRQETKGYLIMSKLHSLVKLGALTAALSCASLAFAADKDSNWLVRVRAIDVAPVLHSSAITGFPAGSKVTSVNSQLVPELDISYFLNPHIAAELILATTRHKVKAGEADLGKVSLLPPTLTLQYHFLPERAVNPYVGVGANYTHFYNVNKGVASDITYTDSFGPALQAGVDVAVDQNWVVNLDVKKLFVKTDATVTAGGVVHTANVTLNPMVYGIGVGYRF